MMAQNQDFEKLLVAMLSSEDAELREAAEAKYTSIPLAEKIGKLVPLYENTLMVKDVRSYALLLLRKLLDSRYDEFSTAMGGGEKFTHFHTFTLERAVAEEEPDLKRRLVDIIAALASNTIDEETGQQMWFDVLRFLERCGTSDNAALRRSAMTLLGDVPQIFGEDQNKYIGGIAEMLKSSLLFPGDQGVRLAASRAYVSFLTENCGELDVVTPFTELFPTLLQAAKEMFSTGSDENKEEMLSQLCDLATYIPRVITPCLQETMSLCLSIAKDRGDESAHSTALEVMVSMCESSPNVFRKKCQAYISGLVQLCLELMTEVDDDITEWLKVDDVDDEFDEEEVISGEMTLDRVACALGGTALLESTLHCARQMLMSDDWKRRRAAIAALSTIGEGAQECMEPVLGEILNELLRHAGDQNPRIRYAIANALGQMCTDFSPGFQDKFHALIVPSLLNAAVDLSVPRVAAHACAAVVNFICEDCPEAVVKQYLPQLVETMSNVVIAAHRVFIETGRKLVLAQVITTIGSIVDAAEEAASHFFIRFQQMFGREVTNWEALKPLYGRMFETASIIGKAMGESFKPDAHKLVSLSLLSNIDFTSIDDLSYFFNSWARLCLILKEEFSPYLQPIMSVVMSEDFVPDEEAGRMLAIFLTNVPDHFARYFENTAEILLGMLKMKNSEASRIAAAESLLSIIKYAKGQGTPYLKRVWKVMFSSLRDALDSELELEALAAMLGELANCLDEIGHASVIGDEEIGTIFDILLAQLEDIDATVSEHLAGLQPEEVDQEEAMEVISFELDIYHQVAGVVQSAFKIFDASLLPEFEKLVPVLTQVLERGRPSDAVQGVFNIFNSLIEFGGQQGRRAYQQVFKAPMVNALQHESEGVREEAERGLKMMGIDTKGGITHAQ